MAQPYPGCRSLILQALQLRDVPEPSRDICIASISSSTIKQYEVGLKYWWRFCQNRSLNVFKITVPLVLEFLSEQYNRGASYGSLNSYRSAIAQIAGPDIANDYRLRRFFRGVYGLRPSLPKYDVTWDPSIVLDYIRKIPDEPNSLEFLSFKLSTLLALATGQRVQTIANIEIQNIIVEQDNIVIKIPKRIKTSGRGRIQPSLILPFFKQEPKICVAQALIQYLNLTKDIRQDALKNLFITFKKPFRNASAQSMD